MIPMISVSRGDRYAIEEEEEKVSVRAEKESGSEISYGDNGGGGGGGGGGVEWASNNGSTESGRLEVKFDRSYKKLIG